MPLRRADDVVYTLLSNGNANGSAVNIRGGSYMFTAEGTVSGATITLQVITPNGTWVTVVVFNAAISTTTLPYAPTSIDLPAGQVRMSVTGGTPSALYGYLIGLG